jgi:hypothetical protein
MRRIAYQRSANFIKLDAFLGYNSRWEDTIRQNDAGPCRRREKLKIFAPKSCAHRINALRIEKDISKIPSQLFRMLRVHRSGAGATARSSAPSGTIRRVAAPHTAP